MKKLPYVLGIALLGLGLAGCSSAEAEAEPPAPNVVPATSDSTVTDSAPSGDNKSERGNIIKQVGQSARLTSMDNPSEMLVNFAVQELTVDPTCTTPYAEAPENGHFVTVDIAAETGPAAVFDKLDYFGDFTFNSGLWKFITPQGTTVNSIATTPAYSCLTEQETLPAMIGPAEKATGKIVLDVPTTKGTLIFSDMLAQESWEWQVPGN